MILHWQQIVLYYTGSVDRAALNKAHSGLIGRAGQTSYALLLCKAATEGVQRYASGHGLHAEGRLLTSDMWVRQIPAALARRSALDSEPLVVTLAINRSPCAECATALAGALDRLWMSYSARMENARFICASLGYYQGDFVGGAQPGIRRDRVTTDKSLSRMLDAGWELCVLQMDNALPPRGAELLEYFDGKPGRRDRHVRLDSA